MTQHTWIKSTLGHGESMCSKCFITNREAAVLGKMNTCSASNPASAVTDVERAQGVEGATHSLKRQPLNLGIRAESPEDLGQIEYELLHQHRLKLREALRPFTYFLTFINAARELSGEVPLSPSDVVIQYSSSGGSASLTVKHFMDAAKAIDETA